MQRLLLVGFLCLLALPSRADERWEVAGTSAFQVSGGGAEHIQLGVDGSYAFHRRLRLHLAGSWMFGWQTVRDESTQFLLQNLESSSFEAPILLRQMLTVGVEGIPLTGQATLLSLPMDLDFFIRIDGGAANSRVQLQAMTENDGGATYGGAGIRPVVGASIGMRARMKALIVRLSLSTLSFPSKLDRVNGCATADLISMQSEGTFSTACDSGAFADLQTDSAIAADLIQNSKAGWSTLVMLGLSAGVAF